MMAEMISRIQLQPCLIMRGKKKKASTHSCNMTERNKNNQEKSRKIKPSQEFKLKWEIKDLDDRRLYYWSAERRFCMASSSSSGFSKSAILLSLFSCFLSLLTSGIFPSTP